MTIRALTLAFGLLLPAGAALAAGTVQLTGDQLRQAISNKTVYLKISGFELPIRYAANGSMTGRMGTVAASFSKGESPTDSGKWWVKGDQLCQRWAKWMSGKQYCYRLSQKGSTVHWVRHDGKSGTARIGG